MIAKDAFVPLDVFIDWITMIGFDAMTSIFIFFFVMILLVNHVYIHFVLLSLISHRLGRFLFLEWCVRDLVTTLPSYEY